MAAKVGRQHEIQKNYLDSLEMTLNTLMKDSELDIIELKSTLALFKNKLAIYDSAQEKLEEKADDEHLVEIINTNLEYRRGLEKTKQYVDNFILEKSLTLRKNVEGSAEIVVGLSGKESNKESESTSECENAMGGVKSNYQNRTRLPKLTLPVFSGKVCDYKSFINRFDSSIGSDPTLDSSTKLSYLLSLLSGEALSTVKGIEISDANYQLVRDLLSRRFGSEDKIIYAHLNALQNLSLSGNSPASMWKFYDTIQIQTRSLEGLGVKTQEYGVLLVHTIMQKLPREMCLQYMERVGGKPELDSLIEFLFRAIHLREASAVYMSPSNGDKRESDRASKSRFRNSGSVSQFHVDSGSACKNKTLCEFCKRSNHPSYRCYSLKDLRPNELRERLDKLNLCRLCFEQGHRMSTCTSNIRCNHCTRRHNTLLHNDDAPRVLTQKSKQKDDKRKGSVKNKSDGNASQFFSHSELTHKVTLMQTAKIYVNDRDGRPVEIICLFDTASDRSCITQSAVDKLGLKRIARERLSFNGFAQTENAPPSRRNIYSLNLGGEPVELVSLETICHEMYRESVPNLILEQFDLSFTDDLSENQHITVDVLIGLDFYWSIVENDFKKIDNLVATKTKIGWVLSGAYQGTQQIENTQLFCSSKSQCLSNELIENMWALDNVGLNASYEEDNTVKNFLDTLKYEDKRYVVELPFQEEKKHLLMDNRSTAEKRLRTLSKRFAKDPPLKEAYDLNIKDMVDQGIVREVTPQMNEEKGEDLLYYIPHMPVIRNDKITSKIRPVFDCSCKGPNGVSLNNILQTGPNLLPSLVQILLRFRRFPIAVVADIKQAFLQIKIAKKDQSALRFLWEYEEKIHEMQFDRLCFGAVCSPFILHMTIKTHLKKFDQEERAVKELQNNLYMDDFLSGSNTREEVSRLVSKATEIMEEASFVLTKWSSNDKEIADLAPKKFDTRTDSFCSTKVLGLEWDPKSDCFSFRGIEDEIVGPLTKRKLLSQVCLTFDPLGIIAPVLIGIKCLFQKIWTLELNWDDKLPPEFGQTFLQWKDDLKILRNWKIPRCIGLMAWDPNSDMELHVFCDASQAAYGSAIYLKSRRDDQVKVSLVMSKTRVAPLKRITLPRLELMAMVIGAQLLQFAREALELPSEIPCVCYSDSTIALAWVKNDAHKFKMFVGNRIQQIRNITSPDQWHHCKGATNPADLLTRGIRASSLIKSKLWLEGPEWLMTDSLPVNNPPPENEEKDPVIQEAIESEKKASVANLVMEIDSVPETIPMSRWGTLLRAMRVLGWVRRFIDKTRKRKIPNQELEPEELQSSMATMIRISQEEHYSDELKNIRKENFVSRSSPLLKLNPFLDEQGLLRAKTRLNYSELSFDEKYPIILSSKSHLATLLVREQHIQLKHAGVNQTIAAVRNKYWIVGLRCLARRIKRHCVPCQRIDAKCCKEPYAPLVERRLKQTLPFENVGVDYAGPVYCKDSNKKHYLLLFTCMVIRAIHVELVESMNISDFFLALRRFVARRGLMRYIFSDNFRTFKRAALDVPQIYGTNSPTWQFIAPRSPNWGGLYERLIKEVKLSLKKTVGRRNLRKVELETTLNEIEACVNSRPLTFVGDDLAGHPITPASLLLGRGCHLSNSEAQNVSSNTETVTQVYRQMQSKTEAFWKRWKEEYLKQLPLPPLIKSYGKVKEGTVVILREENTPRLEWPLGVIVELIWGRDGVCRTVKVRTKRGLLTRTVQRVHPLELSAERPRGSSHMVLRN